MSESPQASSILAGAYAAIEDVVLKGSLAELSACIERGVDSNWRSKRGQNLVLLACKRGSALGEAAEICRVLVERHGVPCDAPDEALLQTPLFFSAARGAADVTRYLLTQRVRVDLRDRNSQTPLFYSARHGHAECLRLLLEARASPTCADANGQTPLHYAAKYGRVDCLQALLQESGTADIRDKNGRTALFFAGDAACCQLLLRQRCGPELRDIKEQSALFDAARTGNEAKIRLLLSWRADADAQDKQEQTPLFYATSGGHVGACRLLIDGGADTRRRDSKRQCPLDLAQSMGHVQLLQVLAPSQKKLRLRLMGQPPVAEALAAPQAKGDTGVAASPQAPAAREAMAAVAATPEKAATAAPEASAIEAGSTSAMRKQGSRRPRWSAGVFKPNGGTADEVSTIGQAAGVDAVVDRKTPKKGAIAKAATPSRGLAENSNEAADRRPPKRQRYCLVFTDPENPERVIPFQSEEYLAALRKLCEDNPVLSMDRWTSGKGLTAGPHVGE
mmetsp:Transcript_91705/g.186712  ORF Transcript_91705/g.186712 Transcript_91705/m.186712 type:complete len:505 (+) Transcript_91705:102-1616(+)